MLFKKNTSCLATTTQKKNLSISFLRIQCGESRQSWPLKKAPNAGLKRKKWRCWCWGDRLISPHRPPHPEVEETGLILEGAATDGSGWIRFGVTIIILIVERLCPAASAVGRSF